jgi:hypothetical protein
VPTSFRIISAFWLRLGLPYTAPPSCEVPMTFELLSIAP